MLKVFGVYPICEKTSSLRPRTVFPGALCQSAATRMLVAPTFCSALRGKICRCCPPVALRHMPSCSAPVLLREVTYAYRIQMAHGPRLSAGKSAGFVTSCQCGALKHGPLHGFCVDLFTGCKTSLSLVFPGLSRMDVYFR